MRRGERVREGGFPQIEIVLLSPTVHGVSRQELGVKFLNVNALEAALIGTVVDRLNGKISPSANPSPPLPPSG